MRAKPGQGRTTLQGLARQIAEDLGHDLSNFYSADAKSNRKAAVMFRGRLFEGIKPAVFRATCKVCGRSALIDQHEWERDGRGFGGSATKESCVQTDRTSDGERMVAGWHE